MLGFGYWLIICHLFGDYILQSDWMAQNKTKTAWACLAHVTTYTLPFLILTTSWQALIFIAGSHFVIDHWRLAKYVVFIKNFLAPLRPVWEECKGNGYHKDAPAWLTNWLLIIVDNALHLLLNGLAFTWWVI